MQEIFSYQFQSTSLAIFTFLAFIFIGSGFGFMFWLDFRKRFAVGGHAAGLFVLIVGTLVGLGFGYLSTQPGYIAHVTATREGLTLDYLLFAPRVSLAWDAVDKIDIQQHRLLILDKGGDRYISPVVYRGDQKMMLQSIRALMPEDCR